MFIHDLALELVLAIDGTSCTVPGGQIKNFSFELTPCGFDASLDFWLEAEFDTLFSLFTQALLTEVNFVVQAYYNEPDTPALPVVLQGIVTQKSLAEITIPTVEDIPVLYRHYSIQFADPARVLWRQHFPCELFVDKTMQDVCDAHKGAKITLTYDWPVLQTQHPILFLGLGDSQNKAGFYDFLMWFIQGHDGVYTYDSAANSYKISAAKEDIGEARPLNKLEVDNCRVYFPETPRHNVHVLNAYSGSPQNEEKQNSQVVTGIRKDVLVRTAVTQDFTDRGTLEENKLKLREHEVEVRMKDYPTATILPGYLFTLDGEGWGEQNFTFSKTYRVFKVVCRAAGKRQEAEEDVTLELAGYDIEMSIYLELQSEKYVHLPPYQAPHYPVHVEGKILSETGEETQETYQIYQESTTAADVYKVQVPLWNNQVVIVAYNPNLFPGHFYFPAFKNARVLLAMEFQSAWIKRFLDWRPGARLPAEGQGNHLLMGLSETSQTSMSHIYQEQKPIFHIKRKMDKDTESIQLKEGCMILETKEES